MLYDKKIEIEKYFSISETLDENYDLELDDDLKNLFSILSCCSKKEINLIQDMIKLIIPYLVK